MLIFNLCLSKIAVFQILAHYMAKCQQSTTMTGKSRVRFVSAIVIYHEISAFGITFNIIFFLPNPIFFLHLGLDHLQLTLLNNWDTESVLALNKKLEFPIYF